MSEALSAGAAVAVIAFPLVVIAGVCYAAYRACSWLSAQEQRELDRLNQLMATPMPKYITTKEAREAFQKNLAVIKAQIAKNPILAHHTDAVSRMLALNNSPLRMFLEESRWNELHESKASQNAFNETIKQASGNLTQSSATYIAQSISEAAVKAGFTQQRVNRYNNNVRIVVMEDEQGRSLIANVVESDNGAKLNMDLTGFGDGSCHAVIDKVIEGLSEKDIRLGEIQRRSHYHRDGLMAHKSKRSNKKKTRIYPEEERSQADTRRKQHYHNTSNLKINQ
ncbi:MAG: hypothetical protein AAB116_07385 [Candidatus Poribacteria bacterium]